MVLKKKRVDGIKIASGFWYPYKETDTIVYLTNKRCNKAGEIMYDQSLILPVETYKNLEKTRKRIYRV